MNLKRLAIGMSAAVLGLTACSVPTVEESPCPTDGSLGACCDDETPCAGELACLGDDELRFCTEPCDISVTSCPEGSACTAFEGQSVCVPEGGLVGDPCDPEADAGCRPGLSCLGAQGLGFCTVECGYETLCPSEEVVGDRVCVEFSAGMGTYCMRPCEDEPDCALGLTCFEVPDTGWSVCSPPAPE